MAMNRNTIIFLLISALSTIAFISISYIISNQNITFTVDETIQDWFAFGNEHLFSSMMTWFSYFGSGEVLMLLTIPTILWLWLKKKNAHQALLLCTVMGGGVLLNAGLKFGFQRGRPDEVSYIDFFGYSFEWISYSFPSGHAMRAFLFFGFLVYLLCLHVQNKRMKVVFSSLLVLLILFIGISRITLEAHFPSDIIAAFLVSLAWLTLCITVFQLFLMRKKESVYKRGG